MSETQPPSDQDMHYALVARRCIYPVHEPEVKPKRRRSKKRRADVFVKPQPTMTYFLSRSGNLEEASCCDVVATDFYSGAGAYLIHWKGDAILVSCMQSETGLISVTSGKLLATWGKSELEPYILGKVISMHRKRPAELA